MDTPVTSLLSPELLAANQRLYELRQQTQLQKAEPGQPNHSLNQAVTPWKKVGEGDDSFTTAVAPVATLPSHLGWHSDAVTKAIRTALERRPITPIHDKPWSADRFPSHPGSGDGHSSGHCSADDRTFPPDSPCWLPSDLNTVKHYPSIGIAALREEQAAIYRVWLLCRYLDSQGQGWLPIQDVRKQLTSKESQLRLFGWRRLRQLLGQGHGLFWDWDKEHDRVWLFGAATIAVHFEVAWLAGKPVSLPIKSITGSIGEFKAHLYAAWHSGRKLHNPISRDVQEKITGVPERTQRHYGRVAKIESQTNFAIGPKQTATEMETQAWQRGQALFTFIDYHGRRGRKGCRYIAWHLPNSYLGPHMQAAKGRMRKINRKLKDLVTKGARGNSSKKVEKKYHGNGAEAARALNRNPGSEVYWPMSSTSKRSGLWAVFSLA